ncbi:MAG: hypothetical protein AAGC68_15795, partial [Verrucomicrobiota bacterium]
VQERSPSTINVILPYNSNEIPVQAIQVRNVSFEELAMSLEVISDRQWELIKTGENLWAYYEGRSEEEGIEEKPLATLYAYPMSPFLGTFEVDDLITLFTTIWDYTDVPEPEAMTFHEETSMLLTKATSAQNEVMEKMITELDYAKHVEMKVALHEEEIVEFFENKEKEQLAEFEALKKKSDERTGRFIEDITQLRKELKEADAKIVALSDELAKAKKSN